MINESAVGCTRACCRAGAVALVALLGTWCGPAGPFPSSDPPPSFAIYYTLSNQTGLYYPPGVGTGSSLTGSHVVDIIGGTFIPTGYTKAFGPAWQDFKTYRVINDGRWPAKWDISSVEGCGTGTTTRADITTKLPEVTCLARISSLSVTPSAYDCQYTPSFVTVGFVNIDPGTPADLYIVDNAGTIYETDSVTVDSNGEVVIWGPFPTTSGNYIVVADLYTLPGYEAGQGSLDVYGSFCQ